jgi:hypothetical protein
MTPPSGIMLGGVAPELGIAIPQHAILAWLVPKAAP